MKTQIEFICPHCKNKFEINIYPVINLQSDTDLYEDLFSLELFKIECNQCKKVTMVEYDVLVAVVLRDKEDFADKISYYSFYQNVEREGIVMYEK